MSRKRGYESGRHFRGARVGTRKGERRSENVDSGSVLSWCRERYLLDLESLGYSPKTVETRRRNLLYFLEWAHERGIEDPGVVTRRILVSYRLHVSRHRKANGKLLGLKSQKERLQVVKGLFKWLCREDLLSANPASELELPRGESRLPQHSWSIDDVSSILRLPDVSDVLGLRDRAMLETLYSTGLRRSELARLERRDLNASSSVLFVRLGKGRKDRYVPIGKRALEWVEKYLSSSRPTLDLDGEETLFLTHLGSGFNPDALGRLVCRYVREAGLGGGCHQFRHSCATHMLENGADSRFIQQLLGHAKPESTAIYARVSIQKLAEIHGRTHPSEAK